jgi:flagellar biosynthetic protein FlhB
MPESDMEKTEAPTPRRLQEARQDGNVARSTDLGAACTLMAGLLLLYMFGQRLMRAMARIVEAMLSPAQGPASARPEDLLTLPALAVELLASSMVPFVAVLVIVALAVSVGQVGLLLTLNPLQPKISRLSPLKGLSNMANMRAVIRLIMSLAKVFLIGAVAAVLIGMDFHKVMLLSHLETWPMFGAACDLAFALGMKLAALLLILAIADYAFQKWQREKDLRMSKTEVKDEMKRMEGDPLMKQRRARVARQLALQRIGHDVPKADVVVTNPTHFAVALRYDTASMKAPKVIAKGADYMAMRIRQVAVAHGVPMVERKELAQAIYRTVEVGQQIPPHLYGAVAEILAYVYRLSGRKSA